MNVVMLPKGKEIVETAFSRARKQAAQMKRQRNRLKDAKGKSIKKVEVSSNYFAETLQKAVKSFPELGKLHPFYRELVKATVDMGAVLPSLAQMKASARIAVRLKRLYISRIKALGKGEERKAAGLVREFYGRMASLGKKLEKGIVAYNQNARKMKELPSIKFDLPTVIIAGYPNTGKTTLLGRLTKSEPKVAAYPFTTQKLQIGYLIHNEKSWKRMQLIDTPGLLDRPLEKRNKAERKAVAALQHLAAVIVFVVDPTMRCGFPLEKQVNLLKEVKSEFKAAKVLVVVNKADVASEQELEEARKALGKVAAGESAGGKVVVRGESAGREAAAGERGAGREAAAAGKVAGAKAVVEGKGAGEKVLVEGEGIDGRLRERLQRFI